VKEFVHGEFGRTFPSVASIAGCRAELIQLDVTEVDLEFPPVVEATPIRPDGATSDC
jgi:tRNA pseudouridine synthase 10